MIRRFLAGLALAFVASATLAQSRAHLVDHAAASCGQFFVGGEQPTVDQGSTGPLLDVCQPAYAFEEASAWRQAAWSAEHLVAANIPPAGTDRTNPFHVETALPAEDRSELADYKACSKVDDRGHATPVGDFTDQQERWDTFSLGNMMSQTKVNNEQPHNHIENAVRREVKAHGEAWIVTGPNVPAGAQMLCGRVPQADAIWKAIYIPSTGVIGAYWEPNDDSKTIEQITVAELTARTVLHVDPFPFLSAEKKAEMHELPAPQAGGD